MMYYTATGLKGSNRAERTGRGRAARPRSQVPAGDLPRAGGAARYFTIGAMIRANWLRARLSRLFTVPRLHPVISAISS